MKLGPLSPPRRTALLVLGVFLIEALITLLLLLFLACITPAQPAQAEPLPPAAGLVAGPP